MVSHTLVPPRPLGTCRLTSAGCEALAPLCPGSSTTVVPLSVADRRGEPDADSNKAALYRPGRVVAEAGKVGDTTVPHTASGTRHEISIRGGRPRSAQLLITPHPVASLRSLGTVRRRYRSDRLPRRRPPPDLSRVDRVHLYLARMTPPSTADSRIEGLLSA